MVAPATLIAPEDLSPFASIAPAKAAAMIEDAVAQATDVAPCLLTLDPDDPTPDANGKTAAQKLAKAKSILRAAILRWNDAGSGALSQYSQAAPGGFSASQSVDTRTPGSTRLYYPSEITDLQKICGAQTGSAGAFSVDTAPLPYDGHSLLCALRFGAAYCSCGADISGGTGPLYELDDA